MKTEDLQNAYPNPPEDFHNAVLCSLYKLDNKPPARYGRKRRAVRIAVVCAIVTALGSFTAVAASTRFFGLFSQRVGNFGLQVKVSEASPLKDDAQLKHVKIKFGYMTDGYTRVNHTGGDDIKYHIEGMENSPWYTFGIVPSKDFDNTEEYIIHSEETTVNGHKLVLTTRQMFENGEVDYGATMYFEDWGYIVGAGAYGGADKDELLKIMQHLSLEEDTDYVPETTSGDMVRSDLDKKRLEYDMTSNSDFTMHKPGEAFKWGREEGSDDFTVKVTSIREKTSTDGISENYWKWSPDYSMSYSDFFDESGKLITPYMRHDISENDGVNTQNKEWDTEDDRHFFVVTIELTQNTDKPFAGFDMIGDCSPQVLIRNEDGSYRPNSSENKSNLYQPVLYGNSDTVLSTPGDDMNILNMSKGETRTLTYGIVVDDDVLDNTYLFFNSQGDQKIDDNAERIIFNFRFDCIKITE